MDYEDDNHAPFREVSDGEVLAEDFSILEPTQSLSDQVNGMSAMDKSFMGLVMRSMEQLLLRSEKNRNRLEETIENSYRDMAAIEEEALTDKNRDAKLSLLKWKIDHGIIGSELPKMSMIHHSAEKDRQASLRRANAPADTKHLLTKEEIRGLLQEANAAQAQIDEFKESVREEKA